MKKVFLPLVGIALLCGCVSMTTQDIDSFAVNARNGNHQDLEKLKETANAYLTPCFFNCHVESEPNLGKYAFEQLCDMPIAKSVMPTLVEMDLKLLSQADLDNPWNPPVQELIEKINFIHSKLSNIPANASLSMEDATAAHDLIQKELTWAKNTEATGAVLGYLTKRKGSVYEVLATRYAEVNWLQERIIELSPATTKQGSNSQAVTTSASLNTATEMSTQDSEQSDIAAKESLITQMVRAKYSSEFAYGERLQAERGISGNLGGKVTVSWLDTAHTKANVTADLKGIALMGGTGYYHELYVTCTKAKCQIEKIIRESTLSN